MSSTDTAMSIGNTAQPQEQEQGSWLSQTDYRTGNCPFLAKRRVAYHILIAIYGVCIATIGFRGYNLGNDVEGSNRVSMPPSATVQQHDVERVFNEATG